MAAIKITLPNLTNTNITLQNNKTNNLNLTKPTEQTNTSTQPTKTNIHSNTSNNFFKNKALRMNTSGTSLKDRKNLYFNNTFKPSKQSNNSLYKSNVNLKHINTHNNSNYNNNKNSNNTVKSIFNFNANNNYNTTYNMSTEYKDSNYELDTLTSNKDNNEKLSNARYHSSNHSNNRKYAPPTFSYNSSNKSVIKDSNNLEFGNLLNKQNHQLNFPNILSELETLDVTSLIKNVDPSIDCNEQLKQIEEYDKMIKNEIYVINYQLKKEKSNNKSKTDNERKIMKISNPKMPNYFKKEILDEDRNNNNTKSNNGTTRIDFKILTRCLENDIVIIGQKINDQKYSNGLLSKEVEEIRKNLIYSEIKCDDLRNQFVQLEKEFENNKESHLKLVDEVKKKEDLVANIIDHQIDLRNKKDIMCDSIKLSDAEITQKSALKKYFIAEFNKLVNEENKIRNYYERNLNKYIDSIKVDLELCDKHNSQSLVIKNLEENKIKQWKKTLTRTLSVTKYETLDNLINYFIKSITDYNNFLKFLETLMFSVNKLEKEVDELDFIINFCEQNLELINTKNTKAIKEREKDDHTNNNLNKSNSNYNNRKNSVVIRDKGLNLNNNAITNSNTNFHNKKKNELNDFVDYDLIEDLFEGNKDSLLDDLYEQIFGSCGDNFINELDKSENNKIKEFIKNTVIENKEDTKDKESHIPTTKQLNQALYIIKSHLNVHNKTNTHTNGNANANKKKDIFKSSIYSKISLKNKKRITAELIRIYQYIYIKLNFSQFMKIVKVSYNEYTIPDKDSNQNSDIKEITNNIDEYTTNINLEKKKSSFNSHVKNNTQAIKLTSTFHNKTSDLEEALKHNPSYYLKITKELDIDDYKYIKKIVVNFNLKIRMILLKNVSLNSNNNKKNYLFHQNSFSNAPGSTVNYNSNGNFNSTYNSSFNTSAMLSSKSQYSIQQNLANVNDNALLISLNSNDNIKAEFLKKEHELKDRAKSSYEVNNNIMLKDIKKIAIDIFPLWQKKLNTKHMNKTNLSQKLS